MAATRPFETPLVFSRNEIMRREIALPSVPATIRAPVGIPGKMNLVQRCRMRGGRHDYVLHARAAGPNAFVDCIAEDAFSDSGPHHRWSVGTLFDNIRVEGNAINVQRTVRGYAQAGFACIMIEDQVSPKRCGHTRGKQTVGRDEAFQRVRAAVDARDAGADILIMARTDANATDGFDEALRRVMTFAEMGADITFMEAPRTEDEMRAYCEGVTGPKMANMVEQGDTPRRAPERRGPHGQQNVRYPVTLAPGGIRRGGDGRD